MCSLKNGAKLYKIWNTITERHKGFSFFNLFICFSFF